MRKHSEIDLTFSEDGQTVTVFVSGRRDPIVAGCLGIDRDRRGEPKTVYLNALIHPSFEADAYSNWEPSGAISTILSRLPASRSQS
jgi:hypothetical protein